MINLTHELIPVKNVAVLLILVLLIASTAFADTTLTYQYDANGNLISGDGKYYEYNDANKLVKEKHGDQYGLMTTNDV